MKVTNSKRKGTCAYCGKFVHLTRDHVPPKTLFAKPRTSDLITVPACKRCHEDSSKDDEYFRAAVLTSELVEKDSEAQKTVDSMMDKLVRPEKRGLLSMLNRSVEVAEIWSPGGSIFLGTKPAFRIDQERISRVLERIIRGLFFYELKKPVPDSHEVTATMQPVISEELYNTLQSINFRDPVSISRGAFKYRFQLTNEDPDSTIWFLLFYSSFPALGFTTLPEEQRKRLIQREEKSTQTSQTRGHAEPPASPDGHSATRLPAGEH